MFCCYKIGQVLQLLKLFRNSLNIQYRDIDFKTTLTNVFRSNFIMKESAIQWDSDIGALRLQEDHTTLRNC